jgi:hypothetical protein
LAWDKGYPSTEEGFAGKIVCGRANRVGQLKKNGDLMWHCPFKFGFDYFHLLKEDGSFLKSSYKKEDLEVLLQEGKGSRIEEKKYKGCPAFSFDKPMDLL